MIATLHEIVKIRYSARIAIPWINSLMFRPPTVELCELYSNGRIALSPADRTGALTSTAFSQPEMNFELMHARGVTPGSVKETMGGTAQPPETLFAGCYLSLMGNSSYWQ